MARIVTIVGSLSQQSKTRRLASDLQARIAARSGAETALVDVGALLGELAVCDGREAGPALRAALTAIETADLILAASPVYKGSYSGLFKHLIDLVDYKALAGVPVGLLALGGSDRHALVVEHQMRPLFAFFGAATLPTAVFISDAAIVDGVVQDAALLARLDTLVEEAVTALAARARRDAPARSAA